MAAVATAPAVAVVVTRAAMIATAVAAVVIPTVTPKGTSQPGH